MFAAYPATLIRLVLDPVMYGRARNYLDKGTNNANVDTAAEDFRMFHGVRVYSSINLPVAPRNHRNPRPVHG